MEQVFLSLGSNLGQRDEHIDKARGFLEALAGRIRKISSLYETQPWGTVYGMNFYNLVTELSTHLEPYKLHDKLIEIERLCGRTSVSERYAPRIIDIDMLMFGKRIISTDKLTIPHPLIHERRFVLTPFAEIASGIVHPILHKTIGQLLEECTDDRKVFKIR